MAMRRHPRPSGGTHSCQEDPMAARRYHGRWEVPMAVKSPWGDICRSEGLCNFDGASEATSLILGSESEGLCDFDGASEVTSLILHD